jgi:hypothetical protein
MPFPCLEREEMVLCKSGDGREELSATLDQQTSNRKARLSSFAVCLYLPHALISSIVITAIMMRERCNTFIDAGDTLV